MTPIRVLLVDDHAVVREGVAHLLSAQADIEVVGGAETAWQAVHLVARMRPHVVVMDISLPGLSGVEATRQVHETSPESRVLVLTMHSSPELVYQAFQAGALGYVLKESAGSEVVAAVRSVHEGHSYVSERLRSAAVDRYLKPDAKAGPIASLSVRERQVLQLIVDGRSSAEVAAQLSLSPKSVDTYRSRIMHKLGIGDLPGLVKFAIRHGLTTY